MMHGLLFWLWAATLVSVAWAQADEPDPPRPCVLELRSGDFVRGQLAEISGDNVKWTSEHFSDSFTFPMATVDGIKFAPDAKPPRPQGTFLLEFHNRDSLFADIVAMQDGVVQINSAQFGQADLPLAALRRISRSGPATRVYYVPTRLEDWTQSASSHWRMEQGAFVTEQHMASLYADVGLPEKAAIELDMAWEKQDAQKPSFSIYLGTDESTATQQEAFSLEVWESFAIAQRQTEDEADLGSIAEGVKNGSASLLVFLDQLQGRLLVLDRAGNILTDLQVPKQGGSHSGIKILSRSGRFRLNYMHVRGWSGVAPSDLQRETISVTAGDRVLAGDSLSLAAGQLQLATDNEEAGEPIALDQVTRIDFPNRSSAPKDHRTMISFRDGSRLKGQLLSANAADLEIQLAAALAPIRVPLNTTKGVSFQLDDDTKPPPQSAPDGHRLGKLELMDTRLHGWLVDGEPVGDRPSCLLWKPVNARHAVAIRDNAYGWIVYRSPAGKKPPRPPQQQQQQAFGGGFLAIAGPQPATRPQERKFLPTQSRRGVHLRSGDIIPGNVTSIDETGVHISSSMTETKVIAHEHVKAAELIDNAPIPLLTQEKRDRLLTLPRMQRNAPPSHLLFSKQGDILRGELLAIADSRVEMQVRLSPYEIPLDRVATIVWLHPDEMEDETTDESGATTGFGQRRWQAAGASRAQLGYAFLLLRRVVS